MPRGPTSAARERGPDERPEQRRHRALRRARAGRRPLAGARSTAKSRPRACKGPVTLATVNGSTTFSTSSYGEASTVNGSIRGAMGASGWSDALAFRTVNGSITLELPPDLSADVRASTVNGEISTDFPLTVTGRVSRRHVAGTIGAGGRRCPRSRGIRERQRAPAPCADAPTRDPVRPTSRIR